METKKNIFREHLATWLIANKKGRGEIARNICAIAKIHPKSVARSFKRVQMADPDREERRGRKRVYGNDVTATLKDVWEAASRPCAENLHGQVADYVRILGRDHLWNHEKDPTDKLCAMSLGLMKLRIRVFANIRKQLHGKSTTHPSSIKSLIPIRSGPWDEAKHRHDAN